jgi:glycosyltransferase involved in cell wall biosynthesis
MLEDEQSALLVPAAAPEAFASAMARLLANENLAATLARNGATRIATRFSPDAYRHSLMEVYKGLCPPTSARLMAEAGPDGGGLKG